MVVLFISSAVVAQNIPCLEELEPDSGYVVFQSTLLYSQDHFTGGRVFTNGDSDLYVTNGNFIFEGIHESVFGVLAFESEEVDPRL